MKTRPLWSNFILLLITVMGILVSSCSFVSNSESVEKSKNLNLNFKNSSWVKIDSDKADYAFKHKESRSIMVINSLCKKYDRTTLEQLTENILAGLQESKTTEKNKLRLFDRESLRTKASGKLDGVTTHMMIEVVKKDRCIYDFVLITKKSSLDKNLEADFIELVRSSQAGHQ